MKITIPLYNQSFVLAFNKKQYKAASGRDIPSNSLGVVSIVEGKCYAYIDPEAKDVYNTIAHESWHIVDELCNSLGIDLVPGGNNEHIAYLLGFVTNAIICEYHKEFKDGGRV